MITNVEHKSAVFSVVLEDVLVGQGEAHRYCGDPFPAARCPLNGRAQSHIPSGSSGPRVDGKYSHDRLLINHDWLLVGVVAPPTMTEGSGAGNGGHLA
jgi:hypothetical protein